MKRFSSLVAVMLLIAACSTPAEQPDREPPPQQPAAVYVPDQPNEPPPIAHPQALSTEESYPTIADWLLQRQGVCSQNQDAIDAQLQRHQPDFYGEAQPGKQAHIQLQLQALMLASCKPERTPGLFQEFLKHMENSDQWPEDYHALFALMASQLDAYALLERRFRELEARHQKTIEGIGNIERVVEPQAEPDNPNLQ